ncbi:MAG: hypothetical protein IPH52_28525 [Leptospiraceae bacterium]|nr:hypothetical protein [Leptospiraceae bacterium]
MKPNILKDNMNHVLTISLIVPSEEFELKEILIRADIDRDVFKTFDEATVKAIQEEVGLSAGLLPKLSERQIESMRIGEEVSIEKLEDIPSVDSQAFGSYFADVYLNGTYKWEAGYVVYKANGVKDRDKILNLEGMSREFLLHPETIVKIRRHLGIIRKVDRVEQSMRHLGFTVGVLLGRFDAQTGGLVDLASERLKEKSLEREENAPKPLSGGMYFTSLADLRNSIGSSVSMVDGKIIERAKDVLVYKLGEVKAKEVWDEMEIALLKDCDASSKGMDWVSFFREHYFDLHISKYENRPIYFPLSSAKRNFVFYFNIHTWTTGTFAFILSDFLNPDLNAMKARLDSIQEAKTKANSTEAKQLDKDILQLEKLVLELEEFRNTLDVINTKGIDTNQLEAKVPYVMDLDDGVMVNSSALHPLLSPQWKKPKEIWQGILKPQGKKDYDWSHLAMRYFPKRVFGKCKVDPSLAVAHSNYGIYKDRDLFKELHPEAAKKWEEKNSSSADTSSNPTPMLEGFASAMQTKKRLPRMNTDGHR